MPILSNLRGILIVLTCVVFSGRLVAQAGATGSHLSTKPLSFDVVSIRPSADQTREAFRFSRSEDGYLTRNQSVSVLILMAYFPKKFYLKRGDILLGGPSWIDDLYDINAKVSEADLPAYQKQGKSIAQAPMLVEMLRTMLAERFKLVLHEVSSTEDGYVLELDKQGPKLAEAVPGAELPEGNHLEDGGVFILDNRGEKVRRKFYGASMKDLAENLSTESMGRTVQDKTGLKGKYNFVVEWGDSDGPPGAISFLDPNPLSHWDLAKLGLKVEHTKVPSKKLIIDHIEKPSEN